MSIARIGLLVTVVSVPACHVARISAAAVPHTPGITDQQQMRLTLNRELMVGPFNPGDIYNHQV